MNGATAIDVRPLFNGGEPGIEFIKWVYQNIKYPEEAWRERVSGKAVVKFTVNTDGYLSDFIILQSPHESISREVIRILSQSPAWTPGYINGEPVRVSLTLPISFRFSDSTTSPLP